MGSCLEGEFYHARIDKEQLQPTRVEVVFDRNRGAGSRSCAWYLLETSSSGFRDSGRAQKALRWGYA